MSRDALQGDVAILIESGEELIALRVDEIESIRRVVLKDLGAIDGQEGAFVGAAILGDGTVSLVVDCDNVISLARLASP